MNESNRLPIQFFEPKEEFAVFDRRLPHWSQAGTIVFITWRTWDSIPQPVLEHWLAERAVWLQRHGINPEAEDWQRRLCSLGPESVHEFKAKVSDRWNDDLDGCRGACVLRRPELASMIAESLRHFDGERYELTDFVIMPNHVHFLAAFPDEASMLEQCESWKRFTATKINRALGRKGRFWQQDDFDHLVRSLEQFEHFRRYIAENPHRVHLPAGEYPYWSKLI